MHNLPFASFQVQNVGRTAIEAASRRGDRLLHARPANGSFLPGLDLEARQRKWTQLLELTRPDGACLITVPPLIRIVPDDQRARQLRQPLERRLIVALGHRPRPSFDDPADLLRGLHAVESGSATEPTQYSTQQPASTANALIAGSQRMPSARCRHSRLSQRLGNVT